MINYSVQYEKPTYRREIFYIFNVQSKIQFVDRTVLGTIIKNIALAMPVININGYQHNPNLATYIATITYFEFLS